MSFIYVRLMFKGRVVTMRALSS